MKISVKTVFVDKFTGVQYRVGEILEIADEDRVKDIVSRGLGEVLTEIKKPAPKKRTKKGVK